MTTASILGALSHACETNRSVLNDPFLQSFLPCELILGYVTTIRSGTFEALSKHHVRTLPFHL